MQVALMELLYEADKNTYAIGCFNTPAIEILRGVVSAAEEMHMPIIIAHGEIHENTVPLEVIGPLMINIAERAKIPVVVHLDHGRNVDLVLKAIEMGFNSIMFDGAYLPYDINCKLTAEIVKFAHRKGVAVEGAINAIEKGELTDPEVAQDFVQKTKVDTLAVSFGTRHGIYCDKPILEWDRLREIYERTKIPLVMHGGSGLSESEYELAIKNGIRKINYYTYMALDVSREVKKKLDTAQNEVLYHDIIKWAEESAKRHTMKILKLFSEQKEGILE